MGTIKRSAVLAVALTGLFAGAARAQETIVVKVPFPFVVHGKQMPAGHYDVTSDAGILSIRGTDNRARIFAITLPADGRDPAGDEPALVFVRSEDQNLLSQIWDSEGEGLALQEGAVTPRHDRAEGRPQSSIVLTADGEVSGK